MSITPQSEGRKLIAAYLKERRIELEMTCKQVGDLAGLSESTIWRIEEGKFSPSLDTFLKLTTALKCYFFLESKDGDTENANWMRERWGKPNPN